MLNFDSVRRRMSVIVKSSSGETFTHTHKSHRYQMHVINPRSHTSSNGLFDMFVFLWDLRRIPAVL